MEKPVVLITGTSQGLGLSLAEYYLSKGERVIGCSRGKNESINNQDYQHFEVDVGSEQSIENMFMKIKKNGQQIGLLVNNAGIAHKGYVLRLAQEEISNVLTVNTIGSILVSRYAYKNMRKFKCGNIINISSLHTSLAIEGASVYAASKSALEQFTKSMAKEVSAEGIRVNSVALSIVENTGMAAELDEAMQEKILNQTFIQRSISVREVVHVIDFLRSEFASSITGECIHLGGV